MSKPTPSCSLSVGASQVATTYTKKIFRFKIKKMAKCESLVQMQNTHWPDQGSPWEEKAIIKKKSFHVILFPPLEKAVNRVKLMAVGVRCNLGRDPPGAEEENACTTMCTCPSN